MKFLSDILKGKDNLTYDAARVVGVLGAFAYVVFRAVEVWHSTAFTSAGAKSWREGLAMLLIAMAGAVKLTPARSPAPQMIPARAEILLRPPS